MCACKHVCSVISYTSTIHTYVHMYINSHNVTETNVFGGLYVCICMYICMYVHMCTGNNTRTLHGDKCSNSSDTARARRASAVSLLLPSSSCNVHVVTWLGAAICTLQDAPTYFATSLGVWQWTKAAPYFSYYVHVHHSSCALAWERWRLLDLQTDAKCKHYLFHIGVFHSGDNEHGSCT
jgi:hypothetical protein